MCSKQSAQNSTYNSNTTTQLLSASLLCWLGSIIDLWYYCRRASSTVRRPLVHSSSSIVVLIIVVVVHWWWFKERSGQKKMRVPLPRASVWIVFDAIPDTNCFAALRRNIIKKRWSLYHYSKCNNTATLLLLHSAPTKQRIRIHACHVGNFWYSKSGASSSTTILLHI